MTANANDLPSAVGSLWMNLSIIGRLAWSKSANQFLCWHNWKDAYDYTPLSGRGEVYRCQKCGFEYVTSLAEY